MSSTPPRRVAFLLSQLGGFAASGFAARLAPLDLRPADAGVLRLLGREEGLSQREVAERLGSPPSRLVALIDGLEGRGLVSRERDAADRRRFVLALTPEGRGLLASIGREVALQEEELLGGLAAGEREELAELLGRLAAAHGLDREVHRGYSRG